MNILRNQCKFFLHTSLVILVLISSVDGDRTHNQNRGRNVTHYPQKKFSNGNNHSISKPNQNRGNTVTHQPHNYPSHSQNQHKISNQNQKRNTTHYSQNRISNGNNHSISKPNQNKGHNVTRYSNSNRNDHHEIPNHNRVHNITQQPHNNFSHPKNQQKLTNRYQGQNSTHVSQNKLSNGNNHSISYPHRNREHNITHNPHSNYSNWNNHPKSNLNQNKTHSTTHFPRNNSSNWNDHPKLYPDRIRDHNITHHPSNNFSIGWNVDTNTPPGNKLPIGWNVDTNTHPSNKLPIGWNVDTYTPPSNKLPIGWNADTNTTPSNKLPIRWNDNSNTHTSNDSPIGWNISINIHPNSNSHIRPVDPDAHLKNESNHRVTLFPSSDDSTANVHSHYDKQPDQKLHNRHRPHYHSKDRNPHQEYSSYSNKTLLYKPNSAIKGKLIIEDDLPYPHTICGKTLCSYVLNYPTTEIEDAVGRAHEELKAIILNTYLANQDSSQIINAKNDSSSLTYSAIPNDQLVNESGLCKKYTNEISPLEGFSSEDGITYHIVNVPSFAQTSISIECDSSNGLTCGQTIDATLLETRACQQLYREEKFVVLPVGKRYYKNDDFHITTINVPTDCNCIVSRRGW